MLFPLCRVSYLMQIVLFRPEKMEQMLGNLGPKNAKMVEDATLLEFGIKYKRQVHSYVYSKY